MAEYAPWVKREVLEYIHVGEQLLCSEGLRCDVSFGYGIN
jgi:hypothetical protein